MQPPSNRKEVQRLTGRIASLNRFISKAAKRSLPFFKVLRANSVFQWSAEKQQAFEDLKKYLEEVAVMTKPSPKAELLLYIAATDTTVSAVLVEERMEVDTLKQFPIYYVSEALRGSKLFYSEMEKMTYAVLMAKRKLRHYFQSHNISVPTAFPLRDMFENKESTRRMGKWATELAEHVINFVSRSAIKSQVLADFVADWTPSVTKGDPIVLEPVWEVQCDGAYCHLGSAAAAVLKSPSGIKLRYTLRLNYDNCTNNMAEYEGLLLALRKARVVGARRLVILIDSELVAGHIEKTYKAKKPDMMKYLQAVRSMEKFFIGITVRSFPRHYNNEADAIAKAAALLEPLPLDVFYETTTVRSAANEATPPKFVNAIQSEDWRAPIVAAVRGYYEAKDGVIDKRVTIRARNYHIIDGNLYRKGVCAPLLKCISVTEGKQLLHEIHSGMCSHHLGTRALVQKAFRQGFYWPSVVVDAHDIVRQCPKCQRHAPYNKFASNEIQLMPPSVALRPVGHGHRRSATDSAQKLHPCRGGSRVFFQVGGSKATVKHYFGNNTEILLAEHCVPLRRALRSHRGQWQAVRQHRLQGFLCLSGHQIMLRFSLPPAVQQGGRTGQWGNFHRHQKEHHRFAQEQMGRRAAEGDMVPQHHNF
jgi:ribonuclease HI